MGQEGRRFFVCNDSFVVPFSLNEHLSFNFVLFLTRSLISLVGFLPNRVLLCPSGLMDSGSKIRSSRDTLVETSDRLDDSSHY